MKLSFRRESVHHLFATQVQCLVVTRREPQAFSEAVVCNGRQGVICLKAIALDEENVQHLIIGLSRADVDTILRGDVLVLPPGWPELGAASDTVVLSAETDEQLAQRFPPSLRPV